jgi:hypothetical protein
METERRRDFKTETGIDLTDGFYSDDSIVSENYEISSSSDAGSQGSEVGDSFALKRRS